MSGQKINTRVFALLIGIDDYKHVRPKLKGCENDAKSIKLFLTDTFNYHDGTKCLINDRIKPLVNTQATRKAILDTFNLHFIENDDIKKGDAMVFYFAGHGSRVDTPSGWQTPDGKIETICPYDQDLPSSDHGPPGPPRTSGVGGIPDHEINVLLRKLAEKKGNNIIAIFDSCYSGGIGRDDDEGRDLGTTRSIDTPSLSQEDLDQDAWRINEDRDAKLQSPLGFSYPFMSSHVLLAACQPKWKAKEDFLPYKRKGVDQKHKMRGVFTSNLVTRLYDALSDTNKRSTYATLMGDPLIKLVAPQRPSCEGTNKNRYLFSTDEGPDPLRMFKLTRKGSWYEAEAGWIHGVTAGTKDIKPTEFTIYPNGETLVSRKVFKNYCELAYKDGEKRNIPEDGTAVISTKSSLKVYLEPGVPDIKDIGDHCEIVIAPEAHIVVRADADKKSLHLRGVDERVPKRSRPKSVKSISSQALVPILNNIAYFNFHLHRGPSYRGPTHSALHKHIKLSLVPLETVEGFWIPIEDKAMMLRDDGDNLVPDLAPYYGVSLESTWDYGVFAYLFCFIPWDCTISSYYVPKTADALLSAGSTAKLWMVGYGSEGGDPIKFSLRNKKREDTIFFKLFVSNSYVDMNITQQQVEELRDANRVQTSEQYIWDAWTFPITCRPS